MKKECLSQGSSHHNFSRILLTLFIVCTVSSLAFAQDHVLLSEITLQPAEAEFIEIYNPTNSAIALDNYFLADNQNYPAVASGGLPTLDPGDFVVQFPPGTTINSNQVIVIAVNGADFAIFFGQSADFELVSADAGTPDMVVIDESTAVLSNAGEGIALFHWDGIAGIVQDVDLMNAGVPTSVSRIPDKTGLPGYLPDAHTMPTQSSAPGDGFSTKRLSHEGPNEIQTGGNGISGHDETSEDISVTWDEVFSNASPGITGLTVIGIANADEVGSSMQVFPNPVESKVEIILETDRNNLSILMINSIGVVQQKWVHANTRGVRIFEIDLTDYPSGMYLIVVQTGSEILGVKKIYKM